MHTAAKKGEACTNTAMNNGSVVHTSGGAWYAAASDGACNTAPRYMSPSLPPGGAWCSSASHEASINTGINECFIFVFEGFYAPPHHMVHASTRISALLHDECGGAPPHHRACLLCCLTPSKANVTHWNCGALR
mmetsp:Transcript_3420/g.9125  ORF Transcript_3420/g.9125 Transcript_3420/m.9125 type:complete len:134 (-) Transcript_3420:277-678(-)